MAINDRDRVIVFRTANGDWSFHVKAANGRLIATCGEGYRSRTHAIKIAVRVTGRTPEISQ